MSAYYEQILDDLIWRYVLRPEYGVSLEDKLAHFADIKSAHKGSYHDTYCKLRDAYHRAEEWLFFGYRLNRSKRQIHGSSFDLPTEALAWRVQSAWPIETAEAERLVWLTKE